MLLFIYLLRSHLFSFYQLIVFRQFAVFSGCCCYCCCILVKLCNGLWLMALFLFTMLLSSYSSIISVLWCFLFIPQIARIYCILLFSFFLHSVFFPFLIHSFIFPWCERCCCLLCHLYFVFFPLHYPLPFFLFRLQSSGRYFGFIPPISNTFNVFLYLLLSHSFSIPMLVGIFSFCFYHGSASLFVSLVYLLFILHSKKF